MDGRAGDVFPPLPLSRSANPLRPNFSCRWLSYVDDIEARLACDEDFRSFLRFRNDMFSLSSKVLLLVIDLEGLFSPPFSSDDNSQLSRFGLPTPKKVDRIRDSLLLSIFGCAGPAAYMYTASMLLLLLLLFPKRSTGVSSREFSRDAVVLFINCIRCFGPTITKVSVYVVKNVVARLISRSKGTNCGSLALINCEFGGLCASRGIIRIIGWGLLPFRIGKEKRYIPGGGYKFGCCTADEGR